MNCEAFSLGLRVITASIPYMKKLGEDEIKGLWFLLDDQIKRDVPDEAWLWAVKIRLTERDANKDQPIHWQVLRHLYRIENGSPNLRWGLKPDLSERISFCCTYEDIDRRAFDMAHHKQQLAELRAQEEGGSNPILDDLSQ
jgi:hypothetical protein